MKKYLLLPAAALSLATVFASTACNNENKEVSNTDTIKQGPPNPNSDIPVGVGNEGEQSLPATSLSAADDYLDLGTGNNVRIRQNSSGAGYTSESGGNLGLIVNTATRDTFWGPTGQLVNGYVVYRNSVWNVDDMKLERNGEGFKLKSSDGEQKIKMNENETKIKNGEGKLKVSDGEIKYKDDSVKIKSNGHETKIKTKDQKTTIDRHGNVETRSR